MNKKIINFALLFVPLLLACSSNNNDKLINNIESENCSHISTNDETVYATNVRLDVNKIQLDTYARYQYKLHATIEPNNYSGTITWESKNPQLVAIDDDGVITCNRDLDSVTDLSTYVTVAVQKSADESIYAQCDVNVVPVVYQVEIMGDSEISLLRNQILPLEASVLPKISEDEKIDWVSDNPQVVKVNSRTNNEADVVAVSDSGEANIYAYSHQSPSVFDKVHVRVANERGKYFLNIGENNFFDSSTECLKTEANAIHKSTENVPVSQSGYYLKLPKVDNNGNVSEIWIDENSFNKPWQRIRSIQVFYEGGSLDLELSDGNNSSPDIYQSLPSGAKIYDYSFKRYFKISNHSDKDALIDLIIVNFGFGDNYQLASSEFNFNDDTEKEHWSISKIDDESIEIKSLYNGLQSNQYICLQDTTFTLGTISYDLTVNDSSTADLLPKGVSLFVEKEDSTSGDSQLFTGVKTAEAFNEGTVGTGLAGYLTEYIQSSESPIDCRYAYYPGSDPIPTNPIVESDKSVHIDTLVEKSTDLLYDDRTVSLYQDGVFKTQNSLSVFDGITHPDYNHVSISLNQENASISNLKVISYDDVNLWDGFTKSSTLLGEGTKTDPYLISSAEDLSYMAYLINHENRSETQYYTKYYRLTNDISLNGQAWNGIGDIVDDQIYAFEGDFDGGGFHITGLNCTGTTTVALFNYIGSAHIHDLSICGVFSGGSNYTAALAAHVIHIPSLSNRNPLLCEINNVVVEGYISTYYANLGGLVGLIQQTENGDKITISNCENRALLINFHYSSKTLNTGGIVSEIRTENIFNTPIDVEISKCSNYGVIVIPENYNHLYIGGIASYICANTIISDCFQFGDINTYSSSVKEVGGIVGAMYGGKITECSCYCFATIAGDLSFTFDFDGTLSNHIGAICGTRNSKVESESISNSHFCNIKGDILV